MKSVSARQVLREQLGWRAFFLMRLPALPTVFLGVALFVVGITPHNDTNVIYFGFGLGAILAVLLARIPVPSLRSPRDRMLLVGAVVLTTLLAFAVDDNPAIAWTGVGFIVLGLLVLVVQFFVRRSLSAGQLFAYHVYWSPAIDYAGIYGVEPAASEGQPLKIEPQLGCHDPQRIERNLERFALPARGAEHQVEVWCGIAADVIRRLDDLNRAFGSRGQGNNGRVVFDVEMGGFLYLRLNAGRILFAATLDQQHFNDNSFDRDVQALFADLMRRTNPHHA